LNDPLARFLRAAADGDLQTVRAELVHEPEIANVAGPHPFWGGRPTAVTLAAEWGRIDVLRFLLEYGADPDGGPAEYDRWPPLLCAISKGHPEAARLLIEHGARVDAFAAAALGDAGRMAAILSDDPDAVSRTGPNRATPLHFATAVDVARMLIAAGADPEAVDQHGMTPLRTAAYAGDRGRAVARFLLAPDGGADIFVAAALDDTDGIRRLLDRDTTLLDARDPSVGPASARGGTALHIAASLGREAAARALLEHGADPDARSDEGHAPLHYAAGGGHTGMVRLLLEHGATLALADSQHGATAEDWANFFGHHDVERLLRAAHG
jgi:ankyrin repeat protein